MVAGAAGGATLDSLEDEDEVLLAVAEEVNESLRAAIFHRLFLIFSAQSHSHCPDPSHSVEGSRVNWRC